SPASTKGIASDDVEASDASDVRVSALADVGAVASEGEQPSVTTIMLTNEVDANTLPRHPRVAGRTSRACVMKSGCLARQNESMARFGAKNIPDTYRWRAQTASENVGLRRCVAGRGVQGDQLC